MQSRITVIVILLGASIAVFTPQAYSQPPEGTLIKDLFIPNSEGLGIGFDGTYLYWPDFSGTTLHKIDTDGNFVADIPINGCEVTVISYDVSRGMFWGMAGNQISLIDPNTGNCAPQFTVTQGGLKDGLDYDPSDDTLWYSNDGSTVVYHVDTDGTFLGSFPVNTVPECGFNFNSGIATGFTNVIYLAADGCDHIFKYDKDGNKLGSFVIPAFRHEDMECDNVTFADLDTDAMWIKDAFDDHIRAFAVPKDTCGIIIVGLEIEKWVTLDNNGIKVDEMITQLQNAQIVEATLIDPNNNIYVYHNLPDPIPADIPWNDPAWDPSIQFFDGEWQLKMQIIAFYEDPVTNEIKEVEQKIIINFQVMNNEIITINNKPLELHKEIIIDPHPAPLNGNIDITIGEEIMPNVNNVFVAELTIAKPSGTVVSYTALPIDITNNPTTIPFPSTDWNALGANPTIALDEAGLYELDIEIIAFYDDGTVGIHKVNQKLWISFNVLPESAIGAVAIIGASIAVFAVFAYRKKGINN